ncbi:MAG: type II secretion system protein [bacterium]
MKSRFKNQKGISLMEIMVTVSLIVFMASLITINYKSSNKRVEIIMTARKVVSDLRLAQSYAASAKQDSNVDENVWGFYFSTIDKNIYTFFVSNNDTGDYPIPGDDKVFRVIKLPDKISIDKIEVCTGSPCSFQEIRTNITIRFVPPDPSTEIHYNPNSYTKTMITLKDEMNNSIKKIKVNNFGLIEESE